MRHSDEKFERREKWWQEQVRAPQQPLLTSPGCRGRQCGVRPMAPVLCPFPHLCASCVTQNVPQDGLQIPAFCSPESGTSPLWHTAPRVGDCQGGVVSAVTLITGMQGPGGKERPRIGARGHGQEPGWWTMGAGTRILPWPLLGAALLTSLSPWR